MRRSRHDDDGRATADPAADSDDERTSLGRFLDEQRAILLRKAAGLDREQLSRTTAASDLTLAGLLKHLALVEDDQLSARARSSTGRPVTLRWILRHMLTETARHNGHADLLREAIDGATGD